MVAIVFSCFVILLFLKVPVDSQCGDDDICDLDLAVTYINTTYL